MPEPHEKTKDKKKSDKTEKENRAREWGLSREEKPMPGLLLTEARLKCSMADDLAVVLSAEAFSQLYAYAKAMELRSEISCLGSVARKGNLFHIQRFYLVRQTGGFASTELDQSAVAELVEQLIAEGKQDEARSIKCWCHTHGTMNAFWSDTDDSTCRLLVSDYLISLVIGSGFQVRCRLDTQNPLPLTIDGIGVYYEPPVSKEEVDKYTEDLKRHVLPDVIDLRTGCRTDDADGRRRQQRSQKEDTGPAFCGDPVEVFCDYCGDWHKEDRCPLLDAEARFADEWEYGRFC